jgi:hypothetical protein
MKAKRKPAPPLPGFEPGQLDQMSAYDCAWCGAPCHLAECRARHLRCALATMVDRAACILAARNYRKGHGYVPRDREATGRMKRPSKRRAGR